MSSKLYLHVLVAPFPSSTPAPIKDESHSAYMYIDLYSGQRWGDVSVGERFALASFSKMVNNIGSSPDSESHSYKVGEATNSGTSGDGCIKEQDRLLPIANVGRIMKQILPPNAKVSKEAKETMQECVSEFISFVTGEASDKCRKEKRKTVNGDDICWALGTLGFDDYAETLKRYLHKYRDLEGERANSGDHSRSSNTAINEESSSIFRSEHERTQQLGPSPSKFNLIDMNNTSFSRPF